jgi:hypothetical protein
MNVSRKHENTQETDCSGALRYVLVILLAFCLFAVLLIGAIGGSSTATPWRPTRVVPQRFRSTVLRESQAAEKRISDALESRGTDADPALATAAVIHQNLISSTRYTVHVQLPRGGEQFIPVTAPPGGLQLEVRDMTGDNVQNDLVLRPALIHWPLIVLLNDGSDHFTVAVSASFPCSLDYGSRASRGRQIPETEALTSSSQKACPQVGSRQIPVASLLRGFLSPLAQRVTNRTGHKSVSERAPPVIATRL